MKQRIESSIRTLADLERFMSLYLNTTIDSYLQCGCNALIRLKVFVMKYNLKLSLHISKGLYHFILDIHVILNHNIIILNSLFHYF